MNALRGALGRSVAFGVGAGVLIWLFGVPLLQSALVAATALAIGCCYALRLLAFQTAWPDRVGPRRHGTRREVARLASSLSGRERGVPAPTVARLRVLAEQRLARSGIDPHDPGDVAAARRALGDYAHTVLFDGQGDQPSHAAFLACLTAVERLLPDADPAEDDARDHV